MIKENKFKRLTKLQSTIGGIQEYRVLFDGEDVGLVKRTYCGWEAKSSTGRYIGTGTTKGEAKEMVALDFYDDDNIIWND